MPREKGVAGTAPVVKAILPPRSVFLWLLPAFSFCIPLVLGPGSAILAPDATVYRSLATGLRAAVPAPFSARILGPAAAQWLGKLTGLGVDKGFLILGVLSLGTILIAAMYLLCSQDVQPGILAAVFLMPFWLKLFNSYYLPDLLHAAILEALLLCLVYGRLTVAMLLLFPAYLSRESTLLAALCLAWAAWRRVSFQAILAGFSATIAGILVSWHFVHLGAANVRGMGSGEYLAGKLVWGFLRNVFGLPLWTSSFALPNCTPMWSISPPRWFHFGAIHTVGVCPPSAWGPARLLLAWFGVFGIGPAIAAAYFKTTPWRKTVSAATAIRSAGTAIAFRFCVIYGLIAFFLAPLLGASVDRLTEYAWPFYLIALPWIVSQYPVPWRHGRWLLLVHLGACWIAWYGFSREEPTTFYIYAGIAVLTLNIVAYIAVKRSVSRPAVDAPEERSRHIHEA